MRVSPSLPCLIFSTPQKFRVRSFLIIERLSFPFYFTFTPIIQPSTHQSLSPHTYTISRLEFQSLNLSPSLHSSVSHKSRKRTHQNIAPQLYLLIFSSSSPWENSNQNIFLIIKYTYLPFLPSLSLFLPPSTHFTGEANIWTGHPLSISTKISSGRKRKIPLLPLSYKNKKTKISQCLQFSPASARSLSANPTIRKRGTTKRAPSQTPPLPAAVITLPPPPVVANPTTGWKHSNPGPPLSFVPRHHQRSKINKLGNCPAKGDVVRITIIMCYRNLSLLR